MRRLRAATAAATLILAAAPILGGDEEPPVTALAFAPDGRQVLTGSQRGVEVRAWPALQTDRSVETALESVHDLRFAPDGTRFALAGGRPGVSGGVEVRTWPEGTLVATVAGLDDLVYAVAWSPEGDAIACAGHDGTVRVHAAADGRRTATLTGHSRPVLALCFAGAHLVSAGADRSLRVWDLERGEARRVLDHHTDAVLALARRPGEHDLPVVASVGRDRTLRLWQPTIGRLVRFTRFEATPLAVDWTPGGQYVLAGTSDGTLHVVDPRTARVVLESDAIEGWAYCVAAFPGGPAAAVAGEGGRGVRVRWDAFAAPDATGASRAEARDATREETSREGGLESNEKETP